MVVAFSSLTIRGGMGKTLFFLSVDTKDKCPIVTVPNNRSEMLYTGATTVNETMIVTKRNTDI